MEKSSAKELYRLVSEWNKKINITAISGYDDFIVKHIKDSELGEKFLEGNKLLDIGSGGGFPALVFALNGNGTRDITMIDSVGKKVAVVNDIIKRMGIENARAVHCRIEDFTEKEAFDTVTARAVARLNVLIEYALPFVRVGGVFIAYKSAETDEEINEAETAIKILGGKLERVAEEILEGGIIRKFVIVRKIKPCDKIYPRRNNLPRQRPL